MADSKKVPSKPRYVDPGGMQSYPPPSSFTDVTAHCFVVKGDRSRLQALVDRMLNEPAGGAVEYVVLSSHVLLTFIDVEVGRFDAFPDRGYGTEHECDFWVPIARVKRHGKLKLLEEVAFFMPYLFVDNSAAIISGREVYGFLKQWGWISMPTADEPDAPFWCDVQGTAVFSENAHIERTRLLSVEPAADARDGSELQDFGAAVHAVAHAMKIHHGITLPGFNLAKELLEMLLKGELPVVFLKQFRDIEEGDGACYQAITETKARIDAFKGVHREGAVDLDLAVLDSHPIGCDLGIESQRAALALRARLDFSALPGRVIWEAE
ncbi:MAG: acetoacetate decarboxylase family protein [Acidobacteriota bacterium]